jgi:hypothetical protein
VIPCRELFARAAEAVAVIGPLLQDEARDVHLDTGRCLLYAK